MGVFELVLALLLIIRGVAPTPIRQ
jgi:hypothetical protein